MKIISRIIQTAAVIMTLHCFAQNGIIVKSVKVQDIPFKDVKNSAWNNAPSAAVPVMPQNIVAPMQTMPSIKNINVRSINNGEWVAFLLEWTDSTRDAIIDVNKFTDQVAVQFPFDVVNSPSYMMGNMKGRVHIIHWKAAWQDDIDKGYRDVKDAHPNYWTDIYYFADKSAENTQPKDISLNQLQSSEAKNYMPGMYANNPVSNYKRTEPAEEAVAEGYGTFTTQEMQNAKAFGVWENNTWKVIIARPLKSSDTNDAPLPQKGKMCFAVWNGAKDNIASRKHYAMWTDLVIE